jgi:plasmid maintenance system antidote protein VapI
MKPQYVGINALQELIYPPNGAGYSVKKFLERKKINATEASKTLDVHQSTVKRLIDGGALTPSMAAKLNISFGLSISLLFNLEANHLTYKAERIISQQAMFNDVIEMFANDLVALKEKRPEEWEGRDNYITMYDIHSTFLASAHELGIKPELTHDCWSNKEDVLNIEIVGELLSQAIYEKLLVKMDTINKLNLDALPMVNSILGRMAEFIMIYGHQEKILYPLFEYKDSPYDDMIKNYHQSYEQELNFYLSSKIDNDKLLALVKSSKPHMIRSEEHVENLNKYPVFMSTKLIWRYAQISARKFTSTEIMSSLMKDFSQTKI